MDLHEKEKMYQRLIIFTLLIGMVIYYFEKIVDFLAWIGAMCLPFLFGAGLAGSLTLAHSRNSQMSFMYGFFFVKFLFFTVVCVVIVI